MGAWTVISHLLIFITCTKALISPLTSFEAITFNEKQELDKFAAITTKQNKQWQSKFTPEQKQMLMDTSDEVLLEIKDVDTTQTDFKFRLKSENTHLASVDFEIFPNSSDFINGKWYGNVTIKAHFLGTAKIYVEKININTNTIDGVSNGTLALTIVRRMRIIDHVFTGSVATLVSLLYINFGAALDVNVLRGIVMRPVGPTIGFITQYGLMPVLSYFLGYLIFPNSPEFQLGLFFTGCSPAGGASNIWTVILGGNLDLSILMTTFGTLAAFGMMPLWLFTLGHLIFERINMKVPYMNIATYAIALIVPLSIGLLIQKCSRRLTRVLVRLLKPISTCLIVFIIIFAIITNLYLFELFSLQIVLAGLALPWLGYIIAWIVAKLLKQNSKDALTIAIETGIQNTGISIFLLRFSLPQPQADLTTVIPVSVAIMTPFPLLALYIYKRFIRRNSNSNSGDDDYRNEIKTNEEIDNESIS